MFATLVIGLREGLEAALIVGIIAAFLKQQGQKRVLAWMWIGVAAAAAVCVAVAVGLEVLAADLPQRQQEQLETVIGVVAIVMVTYMIVWMRGHARNLKKEIEAAASGAVANGSAIAFASMAGLAVLREGLETSVFLVAAFNASSNAVPAGLGAVLGIAIAVVLGYGIYRGGVRINLARFFKATGLMLVLVAAGLVMTAFHTAHEAGWLDAGQQQVVDLTWLVRPGSLQSSLLTGVLGLQPRPVLIEVLGWIVYVVVIGGIVLWPAERALPRRAAGAVVGAAAVALLVAAGVVAATAPSVPAGPAASLALEPDGPGAATGILAGHAVTAPREVSVTAQTLRTGTVATPLTSLTEVDDAPGGTRYQQVVSPDLDVESLVADAPRTVTLAQIIAANGGRTPVGLNTSTFGDSAPVVYTASADVVITLDSVHHRPVAATVSYAVTATATPARGAATVLGKVATFAAAHALSPAEAGALAADSDRRAAHDSRTGPVPASLAVVGLIALISAALLLRPELAGALRRRQGTSPDDRHPAGSGETQEKKEIRR
ncbi:FTR1 family protein [Tsukamurella sp. 8F]|uniref:iron uptake transporter permease EfeU n=1 Tax=unclassified Tsukamurella TaxID=2633480 RepID=UPI0023B8B7E7|nr:MULTISPECIES: iron uptake transporter permease EfeU [unclassified Tsukamurella]MDF0530084.1 FTR1 family protein [Tsukamurella sp. 8J]MDF0586402.1 FTR1 family protein [Tsukamurella sp. 8F]